MCSDVVLPMVGGNVLQVQQLETNHQRSRVIPAKLDMPPKKTRSIDRHESHGICEIQDPPQITMTSSGLQSMRGMVNFHNPTRMGWDWNPESYSENGLGFLGYICCYM